MIVAARSLVSGMVFRIIVESLFTVVCHARSALDFAANFFGKFHTNSYSVGPMT